MIRPPSAAIKPRAKILDLGYEGARQGITGIHLIRNSGYSRSSYEPNNSNILGETGLIRANYTFKRGPLGPLVDLFWMEGFNQRFTSWCSPLWMQNYTFCCFWPLQFTPPILHFKTYNTLQRQQIRDPPADGVGVDALQYLMKTGSLPLDYHRTTEELRSTQEVTILGLLAVPCWGRVE